MRLVKNTRSWMNLLLAMVPARWIRLFILSPAQAGLGCSLIVLPALKRWAKSNVRYADRLLTAPCVLLKSCRPLTHHTERPFQRNSYLADQTVIEQAPEDGNAVRHAAGGIDLGQRIIWIGGPVAARFRHRSEEHTSELQSP